MDQTRNVRFSGEEWGPIEAAVDIQSGLAVLLVCVCVVLAINRSTTHLNIRY